MPPDLSTRLQAPGVADAFETVVSLFVEGVSREDHERMVRAGYAFGHLCELVGGGLETRDRLLVLVRDAAMEAVRVAGGLQKAS